MLLRSSATLSASEERGRSWRAAAKRTGVMGSLAIYEEVERDGVEVVGGAFVGRWRTTEL
jgi:hypothetical protein